MILGFLGNSWLRFVCLVISPWIAPWDGKSPSETTICWGIFYIYFPSAEQASHQVGYFKFIPWPNPILKPWSCQFPHFVPFWKTKSCSHFWDVVTWCEAWKYSDATADSYLSGNCIEWNRLVRDLKSRWMRSWSSNGSFFFLDQWVWKKTRRSSYGPGIFKGEVEVDELKLAG